MEDLKKSCRLCFNKGELDLFEHKVIIDSINEGNEDDSKYEYYEVDAIDLWRIFQDVDLLNLTMELKLICHLCLEDLISCYKFYIKIRRISEQKQRLFEAAQKLQSEQLDELVVEEFKIEESCEDHLVNEASGEKISQETQNGTALSYNETEKDSTQIPADKAPNENGTTQDPSPAYISELVQYGVEDEKDKFATLPVDVGDNLADNEINSYAENVIFQPDCVEIKEKNEIKQPAQKRPRLKFLREKLAGLTGPVQPPHEDAALVVSQFIPVKAKKKVNTQLLQNEFDSFENSAQDLSTVECTAIVVRSSNLQHLDNGEVELESNEKELENSSKQQIFVCQYCPNAFSAATYLIAHVNKSHVCKYCTKAFVKSLDLFVHIRQAHYQHKCAICQKELSSQSNLRGHIKRVHGIRLPAQVALLDYKMPNSVDKVDF